MSNTLCTPVNVDHTKFDPDCEIPYGLTVEHVCRAMDEFIEFLGFLNEQLIAKSLPRLESFLMPANFSSIVGEFMNTSIPKRCPTIVKNQYYNGHPDLIPISIFRDNSVQYANDGIEIKGSRRPSGWQGHNPEDAWLMVFYFDSDTAADENKGIAPKSFQFKGVYGAKLKKSDWNFSGRSASSRRTITASVNKAGYTKMTDNWIYKV